MAEKYQTRADKALNGPSRTTNMQWWSPDLDDDTAGSRVSNVVRHIRQRTIWRRQSDDLHAQLYAGGPGAAGLVMDARADYRYEPAAMPRNVCRQAVDTIQAKIAKHRPLPQVLTSRGNWKQQKRARKMTQFLEGCFCQTKFFERHYRGLVRDAAIFGRGVLKPYRRGAKILVERVHPWELLVDDWDARYGEPRSLYHVRTLDVSVAIAMFAQDNPELELALLTASGSAPSYEWDWQGEIDASVSRVRVVEAFHLCGDLEAHDDEPAGSVFEEYGGGEKHVCTGSHVIAILGSNTLVREPWGGKMFPYTILNYSDPIAGYWGIGAVEMLEGWQLSINEQFQRVQDGHHMLGGGMILKPTGSDIVDTSFMNGNVPIITYNPGAGKPDFITPAPVHPAIYQRDRDMPIDALSELGLSQTSVQGQKQPGINSGIAIQTLDDIEDERGIIFGRMAEAACLNMAEHFIELASQIGADEEFGEYLVQVPMKGGILSLKWADVSLDEFQLRVFPTSQLPQQLAARLEYLNFLFDRQLIDRQTFMQQLGGPDQMLELDLETADRLNIDEKLENILDAEGQSEVDKAANAATPSAFQDIKWAMRRCQQRYNHAQVEGCPEENLQALREFMSECQSMMSAGAPGPAMAPEAMANMAPGGMQSQGPQVMSPGGPPPGPMPPPGMPTGNA